MWNTVQSHLPFLLENIYLGNGKKKSYEVIMIGDVCQVSTIWPWMSYRKSQSQSESVPESHSCALTSRWSIPSQLMGTCHTKGSGEVKLDWIPLSGEIRLSIFIKFSLFVYSKFQNIKKTKILIAFYFVSQVTRLIHLGVVFFPLFFKDMWALSLSLREATKKH